MSEIWQVGDDCWTDLNTDEYESSGGSSCEMPWHGEIVAEDHGTFTIALIMEPDSTEAYRHPDAAVSPLSGRMLAAVHDDRGGTTQATAGRMWRTEIAALTAKRDECIASAAAHAKAMGEKACFYQSEIDARRSALECQDAPVPSYDEPLAKLIDAARRVVSADKDYREAVRVNTEAARKEAELLDVKNQAEDDRLTATHELWELACRDA